MRNAIRVVVFFLATASTVRAQCDLVCPESLPLSGTAKTATTHTYSLLSKTQFTLSTKQKISLRADAELAVTDGCKSYLSLKNVVVEGVPDAADLATKLAANPVAFGYHNGRLVGGEACVVAGEEDWALNIKLATLSALQVSSTGPEPTELVESDFLGKCKTVYSIVSSGPEKTVVKKEKELNHCSDRRVDLRQSSSMILGQFKELVNQHMHPLHTKSTCKVTLNKDKVIELAECTEESRLLLSRQPFHVSQLELELETSHDGIDGALAGKAYVKKPVRLSYDHKHHHVSNEADVVAVLKKLCSEIPNTNVQIETSITFANLVDKLRYISEDVATNVNEALKSDSICPTASKHLHEVFLSAAALAANEASIKLLVKSHINKELSNLRATAAFAVVALHAAPNGNTIKTLLPLLNSDDTPSPLVLGFSLIARRYCEKANDCAKNPNMKEIRDVYLAKLRKTTDKLEVSTLIKALENVNVVTEDNEALVKALENIINNETAGVAARIAAVKAMPDDASLSEFLKAIVLKRSNPSEVRIAAFHKWTRTAGFKNIQEILKVRDREIKNYVLGYVINLKTSKNPVRRSLIPDNVALPESPKFGATTRTRMREYGPMAVEVDVIGKSVASSINVRVTKVTDNKVHDLFEVELYQEGLDQDADNLLQLFTGQVDPIQFVIKTIKNLIENFVQSTLVGPANSNTLQSTLKVNGKNIIVSEHLYSLVELSEAAGNLALARVFLDSDVVVPTISGIPIAYQIDDNFFTNTSRKAQEGGGKMNVVLNQSLVGSLKASAKMMLKDNKIGYDYSARMALPLDMNIDFDFEKRGRAVMRLNLDDAVDKYTLFEFKQSLKQVKKAAGRAENIENESPVKPGGATCLAPFIMKYCVKPSVVSGLSLPNIEYYVTKPDKSLKAIEFELIDEKTTPDNRQFSAKMRGVGWAVDTEHLAQFTQDGKKESKLLIKLPFIKLEAKTLRESQRSDLNLTLKINVPRLNIAYDGEFRAALLGLNKLGNQIILGASNKFEGYESKWNAVMAPNRSLITWEATNKDNKRSITYSQNEDRFKLDIDLNIDVEIEGNAKLGKIVIKSKDGDVSLESNYTIDNLKLMVDPVSNHSSKLEALIALDEPSKLIFESPNIKTHFKYDSTQPLNKLYFDFDNPGFGFKLTEETEPGKSFKLLSEGKNKTSKKAYNLEMTGMSPNQFNLVLDHPDMRIKAEREQNNLTVQVSTSNNHTSTRKYSFSPEQPLAFIPLLRGIFQ